MLKPSDRRAKNPTVSKFGLAQRSGLQELTNALVVRILGDQATSANANTANEWCDYHLHNHQFTGTDPVEVRRKLGNIVAKLRTHSQMEKAQFLEDRAKAFQSCPLVTEHTEDAHASVLRALLLLSQAPLSVPMQTVRYLKGLRPVENKKEASRGTAEANQRLAEELRELALVDLQSWEKELQVEADEAEAAAASESAPAASDARRNTSEQPDAYAHANSITNATAKAAMLRPSDWVPPRGVLAGQRRHLQIGGTARGIPREALSAGACERLSLHEAAVVQMMLEALEGVPNDLIERDSHGVPELRQVTITGTKIRSDLLEQVLRSLLDLVNQLDRLRALVVVLQGVAPPLADDALCCELGEAVERGSLNLNVIQRISGELPKRGPSAGTVGGSSVFGLCWCSFGSSLQTTLHHVSNKICELQRRLITSMNKGKGPGLALLQLEHVLRSEIQVFDALDAFVDATLTSVGNACANSAAISWPALAAMTLLSRLAKAVEREGIIGGSPPASALASKFEELWVGATSPVLKAMEQWATTGTLHDPCCEFTGKSVITSEIDLLPSAAVSAGHSVQALLSWNKDSANVRELLSKIDALAPTVDPSAGFLWETLGGAFPPKRVGAAPFVPLGRILDLEVLQPTLQLSRGLGRAMMGQLLMSELKGGRGLLCHLEAIRAVAFLECEEAVAPMMLWLFTQLQRGSSLCPEAHSSGSSVGLNASLVEGLEQAGLNIVGPTQACLRLCAKHLVMSTTSSNSGVAEDQVHGPSALECLRIQYSAPPPLDKLVDSSLTSYSAVMALLLQVRYAKWLLGGFHELPLFCARRVLSRDLNKMGRLKGGSPSLQRLMMLAHRSDLLKAEMMHFLTHFEQHLGLRVIREGVATLERELGHLATHDFEDFENDLYDQGMDLLARAQVHHADFLHAISQGCLLLPELRVVLRDVRQLVFQACRLRSALEAVCPAFTDEDLDQSSVASPASSPASKGFDHSLMSDMSESTPWESHAVQVAMDQALAKLADIQKEYRSGARFLFNTLKYSIARSSNRKVAEALTRLNFNAFYNERL